MDDYRHELFDQAKELGIPDYTHLSNDDLRAAIAEHGGAPPADPAADQGEAAAGSDDVEGESIEEARARLGRLFRLEAWQQGHQPPPSDPDPNEEQ